MMKEEHFCQFLQSVVFGLDDYSVDHRGDIGSHVRMASVDALVAVVRVGKMAYRDFTEVVGKLMRLTLERIDRVRESA